MQDKTIKIGDILLEPWTNYDTYWARYTKFEYTNDRICIFLRHKPVIINFFDRLNIFEQPFLFQLDKEYDRNQIEELKDKIDQFLIKANQLQSFI